MGSQRKGWKVPCPGDLKTGPAMSGKWTSRRPGRRAVPWEARRRENVSNRSEKQQGTEEPKNQKPKGAGHGVKEAKSGRECEVVSTAAGEARGGQPASHRGRSGVREGRETSHGQLRDRRRTRANRWANVRNCWSKHEEIQHG